MIDILNYPLIDDDTEDEDFMAEVPVSIIKNSIENQLNNPLEYRKKDYITDFIVKYNYMKENELDVDDGNIDIFHDDFMKFITNIYKEKLDIGFPNIEDMSEEDQHEIIHLVYVFFIRKIKKNFVTIICKELDDHKSELAENLSRKKDITYNTFKEEIGDDEYALIISNLDIVIKEILFKIRDKYDIDKFFEVCDYGEVSADREAIIKAFDDFVITGNFIPKYTDIVIYDEFFIIDIETKVRSHILKNFPLRKVDNIDKMIGNEETLSDNNE